LIGAERFAPDVDQDRVNELDMLRKYLTEATEAVDKCVHPLPRVYLSPAHLCSLKAALHVPV